MGDSLTCISSMYFRASVDRRRGTRTSRRGGLSDLYQLDVKRKVSDSEYFRASVDRRRGTRTSRRGGLSDLY